MAKVKTNVVILSEPASWDQWYDDNKASVPSQIWKYSDLDSDVALNEPVESVMPVDEPLLDGNELPQVWNARIMRNQRYEDVYFKLFQVFKENQKKWERYHEVDAKLRERIQSTVAPQQKAMLRTIYPVRQWLTLMRDSMALPVETLRLNIQLEYRNLMGNKHLDWPIDGSTVRFESLSGELLWLELLRPRLSLWFFRFLFFFDGVFGFSAITAPVSVTPGVSETFGTSFPLRVTPWVANADRVALGLLTGFSIERCFQCSQWKYIDELILAGVYSAVVCFRMLSFILLK